ncbi:hypothetical protein CGLO_18073 [Colletotrichum gloeosporioides Cg-14]|uniref:Uncharacterized protein n=1 Tax=Colletotrichum gloeosporioides (strain Cg-14) TaxID=1237896 RepID=T0KVC0_COLGC|nr:hypothetical protein CGLO_18073 [Colletotrichum gloeosporioides Cg-14]
MVAKAGIYFKNGFQSLWTCLTIFDFIDFMDRNLMGRFFY